MGAQGKVEYIRLSDEKAAEIGAEMLGEAFLYGVAASYMLYEYWKSIKKGIEKDAATTDNISDLQEQLAKMNNQLDRLAHTVETLKAEQSSDKIIKK